jgi:hypothetical protein
MTSLAPLFVGFSVLSASLLALTHFRDAHYSGQAGARTFGLVLVFSLAGLQVAHFGWLYLDQPWVMSLPHRSRKRTHFCSSERTRSVRSEQPGKGSRDRGINAAGVSPRLCRESP